MNPILTIVTLLSADYQIFYNLMENKDAIKLTKQTFSPCSDHMALAWLYHQWEEYCRHGSHRGEQFCNDKGIYSNNMALTRSKL